MDKMRVTFHQAAEIELYDAALYYESQRRGLGSTFLQAIETAMDEIRENPMASPRVQSVVRSKRVRRFPYSKVDSRDCEVYGACFRSRASGPSRWAGT